MSSASVLVATATCLLGITKIGSSFFLPSKVACLDAQLQRVARCGHCCQTHNDHDTVFSRKRAHRRAKTHSVTMERARGKFKSLAKPKFDRNNPNAVLGEITVPGLEQASYIHVSIHDSTVSTDLDSHSSFQ